MTQAQRIALGSVVVGAVVLVVKLAAWFFTGSVAILSDALESIVNVATAIAALVAVRVAARPPDASHPYGHHKAEFFSAVLEGVMIVIAALLILHEAWGRFWEPAAITQPWLGSAIVVVASVINGAWALVLIRKGKALKSPALSADGKHLQTDVVTSIGVIIGIAAAVATGWYWLDPLMAALVALNILWSGWHVIASSLSGLMDESVSEDELADLRNLISDHAEGAVEAHDLRTRVAGRATFVDFHLVVPGDMSVTAAHEICDRIEVALKKHLDECIVTIHVEPEDHAKHTGIVVL